MNLEQLHNVYFIGIGGIGMSALARYFVANNINVAGYDRTQTEITDGLVDLGVQIHFDDDIDRVDESFLNIGNTLVVSTPAVPNSHSELTYFRTNEFTFLIFLKSSLFQHKGGFLNKNGLYNLSANSET